MRTSNSPFDGNSPDDGSPSYEWLDEWLCEYVDGTMDPSLEAVFEQYVEANPDLKAHVERLRQTRDLLCGCELPAEPPRETKAEVCSEVEEDLLQSSPSLANAVNERPVATLGLASSVVVALVVGFLAGSMFVDPATLSPTPISSTVDREASTQTVQEASAPRVHRSRTQDPVPPRLGNMTPTLQPRGTSSPTGESLFLHRTADPVSHSDTLRGTSTFTTADTR